MTQFHRTTQPKIKCLLIVLIGAVIGQSCNPSVPASTPLPAVEPSSTETAIPSATPTPPPSQTPSEPPTATAEPAPEFFAGFTQNEEVPFLLLHRSGEAIAALGIENEPDIIGAVWLSADQKSSLVVYADREGLPQQAAVGQDTLFFSNHSGDKMDMTVVHADGSEETIPVELDTTLLDRIADISVQSLILVSYSADLPRADWLDETQKVLSTIGAVACLKTLSSGIPPLLILAEACTGTLLEGAIKHGKKFGQNTKPLEEIKLGQDMVWCLSILRTGNPFTVLSCLEALVSLLIQIRDFAEESNRTKPRWIQYGTFDPTEIQSPVSSVPGTVTQQSSCRYAPSEFHLYKTGFKPQTPVKIIGRDADGDWLQIELGGRNTPCWINASLVQVEGDVMALPDTYPIDRRLQSSDAFPQLTLISASPGGNGVTASWVHFEIREDLKQTGMVEYIIEVWTCVDGKPAFYAVGTNDTVATFQIDNSCGVTSYAHLIGQDEHGFSFPTTIPLP
jgi:hypothetical protein